MASFLLKIAHFPTPVYSTPNFKNVSLALHPRNFVSRELIIRAKIFLYDPTLIHNTSVTDRQTNGRTRDRRRLQHIAVIKKARQKLCTI